ncbi:MAG: type IV secretion system protein [Rickettsiales bacterium]|jgi:hypothetical protein|nr:type IV secretion system protein [Rickettsiales bacterium]
MFYRLRLLGNVFCIARQYISIFVAIATFSLFISQNAFAVNDVLREVRYNPHKVGGEYVFNSTMGDLLYLPYFGISDDPNSATNGDMNIEMLNPFCFAYLAAFILAMYAGNWAQRIVFVLLLVALVSIIYAVAFYVMRDYEICGSDWLVWGTQETEGDVSNIKKYYPELGAFKGSKKWIAETCTKDAKKCIEWCAKKGNRKCTKNSECLEFSGNQEQCFLNINFMAGRDYLDMTDKLYREYYYDGEEIYVDECNDPRDVAKTYDINKGLNEDEIRQVYYYRGTNKANFACDRFLIERKHGGDKHDQAYKCCIDQSRKICISDKSKTSDQKGLKGNLCSVSNSSYKICGISAYLFKIEKGADMDGKYCVSTWSLCPYNMNLQKGTEKIMDFGSKLIKKSDGTAILEDECVYQVNDSYETLSCKGQPKNFYQIDRHCSYVDSYADKQEEVEKYSPYFDKSCINMVGSSHNASGYAIYKGYEPAPSVYPNSMSAPLVECVSETIKNMMYNRAGHTRCSNQFQVPSSDETCESGVTFMKGEDLSKNPNVYESATVRLLKYIRNLVMISLTIMIMLYGWNILLKMGNIDKTEMYYMLIKIMIVIAFTFEPWWHGQMYRFVYTFMDTFTSFTTRILLDTTVDLSGNLVKDDGCYFGNLEELMGTINESKIGKMTENNYYQYPGDRQYVMFFDTLDCKIKKYLGISFLGNTSAVLTMLAITFVWPFNIGLYLLVGSLIFMFFLISFLIKAAYYFITSVIAIGIMLYISPIIIPCILFKKTKAFFDKWLSSICTYSLQPMMLFAYISMAISIIDTYTLGDAIFIGRGRDKHIMCGYACIAREKRSTFNENGGFVVDGIIVDYVNTRKDTIKINEAMQYCKNYDAETEFIDLKRNSVLCFMEQMTSKPVSALSGLGINLSMITDITIGDLIAIIRVAFLLFILNSALGTIPSVIEAIIGGKALPQSSLKADPFHLASEAMKIAKGVRRNLHIPKKEGKPEEPKDIPEKDKPDNKQKRDEVTSEGKDGGEKPTDTLESSGGKGG